MSTVEPIVRPGQKAPYRKGTRQQIEKRIESAALLLFLGYEKSEIHRIFREFYEVEWRQTDRYMACARARDGTKSQQFTLADRRRLIQNPMITKDFKIIGPVCRQHRK